MWYVIYDDDDDGPFCTNETPADTDIILFQGNIVDANREFQKAWEHHLLVLSMNAEYERRPMSEFFISATKHDGEAFVQIEPKNGQIVRFPLTKRGCIEAGKYLFHAGATSWMNSSSVDFPKEVKPTFRHNVSDLIMEGYNSLLGKPAETVIQELRVANYEIRGNQFVAIAINVNDPKDSHYFDIDPDVNNNAFIRACGWAYEPED